MRFAATRRANLISLSVAARRAYCQLLLVRGRRLSPPRHDDRRRRGQAFDKTAKLLGLGYPGGPAVDASRARAIRTPCRCRARSSAAPTISRSRVSKARSRAAASALRRPDSPRRSSRRSSALLSMQPHRAPPAPMPRHSWSQVGRCQWRDPRRAHRSRRALRSAFVAPPLWLCTDNGAMIAWAGAEPSRQGFSTIFRLQRARAGRSIPTRKPCAAPGESMTSYRNFGVIGGGAGHRAGPDARGRRRAVRLWAREASCCGDQCQHCPGVLPAPRCERDRNRRTDRHGRPRPLLVVVPVPFLRAVLANCRRATPLIFAARGWRRAALPSRSTWRATSRRSSRAVLSGPPSRTRSPRPSRPRSPRRRSTSRPISPVPSHARISALCLGRRHRRRNWRRDQISSDRLRHRRRRRARAQRARGAHQPRFCRDDPVRAGTRGTGETLAGLAGLGD